MGLKAKFNMVMLLAFIGGLGLAAALSWRIVHDNVRREVLLEARIMMAEASAIRDYTANEIEPLLADQIKTRFLPHTVPSWAAQTNLRAMAAQFPDYTYKEAALNPTNPADRATDWESGIIGQFFRQFGLTVSAAVLVSLFVAFTLDPMLSSRFSKAIDHNEVDSFAWVKRSEEHTSELQSPA